MAGTLALLGDPAEFEARPAVPAPVDEFAQFSVGRGLFGLFRRHARKAEEGGSALDLSEADAVPSAALSVAQ
ncbi:hypothetical protein AWV80_05240 [Cupriavidus sp. UYMU48A]|nr:hypothetical protein AWV80_05240 [Cupriavidus sp. UYMU48A]